MPFELKNGQLVEISSSERVVNVEELISYKAALEENLSQIQAKINELEAAIALVV